MGLWESLGFGNKSTAQQPAPPSSAPGEHVAAAGENTAAGSGPKIRSEACRGCGACLDECPHGVFAMGRHDDTARVARSQDCNPECGLCADACPEGGISFPGRPE